MKSAIVEQRNQYAEWVRPRYSGRVKAMHALLAVSGVVLAASVGVLAVLAPAERADDVFPPTVREGASEALDLSTSEVVDSGLAIPITPEAQGWVSDHAGLLTLDERASLESQLSAFEARSGVEFAILTVPSTGAESIAEFSLRVAREWGVGKKKSENGLLIVVAREDRRARIEVADGLAQGSIPDSLAQDVMTRLMVPAFRDGRWADGLVAGTRSLIAAAEAK